MNLLPILFLLGNKNGLRSLKETLETAARFQNQIEQMQKITALLPMLRAAQSNAEGQSEQADPYVDTLSDLLSRLKGAGP